MRLRVLRDALTADAVKGASREELLTLVYLFSREGDETSFEEIAEATGIARSRVAAAIALFCEEGVLIECKAPLVTEEFGERVRLGELYEEPSVEVARTIRDEGLASLIDEVARLMKKDSLSTVEAKTVTQLISQYSLSPEYMLLLATHIASISSRLTVTALRDKAIKLALSEITTVEELEKYIETVSLENDIHREFRRVMGIYNHALSPTQKKYFTKWGVEYGFGTPIVTEAYDRAALNAGGSIKYMDKILTEWHKAGCKTVAECIAHSESTKSGAKKAGAAKKPEPVRYGDFDVNDAFERALQRSYGTTSEEGK